MKPLRQTCAAAILTLTLTVAAYAGQIQCPAAVPTTGGDTTATIVLAIVSVIYS